MFIYKEYESGKIETLLPGMFTVFLDSRTPHLLRVVLDEVICDVNGTHHKPFKTFFLG